MLGILLVATMTTGSTVKAIIAAAAGLLLAAIGLDQFVGVERLPATCWNCPTAWTSSRSRWACLDSAKSSTP
jgi:hypothetical protein